MTRTMLPTFQTTPNDVIRERLGQTNGHAQPPLRASALLAEIVKNTQTINEIGERVSALINRLGDFSTTALSSPPDDRLNRAAGEVQPAKPSTAMDTQSQAIFDLTDRIATLEAIVNRFA